MRQERTAKFLPGAAEPLISFLQNVNKIMTKGRPSKALGLFKNLCKSLHEKLLMGISRHEVRGTALPLIRKGQRMGRISCSDRGAGVTAHGSTTQSRTPGRPNLQVTQNC